MSTGLLVFLFTFPFAALGVSIYIGRRTMRKTGQAGKAFKRHFISLAAMVVLGAAFTLAASAADSGTAAATPISADITSNAVALMTGPSAGLGFISVGLAIGLACLGAGIALGGGIPAAIGAVSEDPKAFGKAIIFVALGEALAIYGFVLGILIWTKIPSLPV